MGIRLEGAVAIVTGAAAGIGQVFSVALAAEGARVILADIASAQQTQALIEAAGGEALSLICDVTSETDITAMADAALKKYGKIDILVNNAGIYPIANIEDTDMALWNRIIGINLTGTFLATRSVVPTMKVAGKGKIINISSGTFFMGTPGLAPYVATKGAVIGMARSLAAELGDFNIQVNCIAPGLTTTPGVNNGMGEAMRDGVVMMQANKRREIPEDMTGALLFLASSDSDFMTGQVMLVDGGAARS
ncbi:MAG: SDR family oxidoreductase [Immundisolibacteraceae bacterium]|nr:SDR family oxidoreductase [Immundisolibacteraceae bacterium]